MSSSHPPPPPPSLPPPPQTQLDHPDWSLESQQALQGARETMRTAGPFGTAVRAGLQAVAKADTGQKLSMVLVREVGTPPAADGFYVFRVSCVGSKGWRFHAVTCRKAGASILWSEPVAGVYQGYRLDVGDKKRRAKPAPLSPAGSSSSEGVVSQGTISAWELAVEQHAAGSSSSEAITLNGKTLTEAEWESEAQTFHEEDLRCQFLEFSGFTEEAYVERKIQAEERNLKKRKQAGEAAKQAGQWN
jgi:hypothetical protein